jgi:hypothetical protein
MEETRRGSRSQFDFSADPWINERRSQRSRVTYAKPKAVYSIGSGDDQPSSIRPSVSKPIRSETNSRRKKKYKKNSSRSKKRDASPVDVVRQRQNQKPSRERSRTRRKQQVSTKERVRTPAGNSSIVRQPLFEQMHSKHSHSERKRRWCNNLENDYTFTYKYQEPQEVGKYHSLDSILQFWPISRFSGPGKFQGHFLEPILSEEGQQSTRTYFRGNSETVVNWREAPHNYGFPKAEVDAMVDWLDQPGILNPTNGALNGRAVSGLLSFIMRLLDEKRFTVFTLRKVSLTGNSDHYKTYAFRGWSAEDRRNFGKGIFNAPRLPGAPVNLGRLPPPRAYWVSARRRASEPDPYDDTENYSDYPDANEYDTSWSGDDRQYGVQTSELMHRSRAQPCDVRERDWGKEEKFRQFGDSRASVSTTQRSSKRTTVQGDRDDAAGDVTVLNNCSNPKLAPTEGSDSSPPSTLVTPGFKRVPGTRYQPDDWYAAVGPVFSQLAAISSWACSEEESIRCQQTVDEIVRTFATTLQCEYDRHHEACQQFHRAQGAALDSAIDYTSVPNGHFESESVDESGVSAASSDQELSGGSEGE